MCIAGFEWDDIIVNVAEDCRKRLSELNQLHLVITTRFLGFKNNDTNPEFQVFVDASALVYKSFAHISKMTQMRNFADEHAALDTGK